MISEADMEKAKKNVVETLPGIDNLYLSQKNVLKRLLLKENIFLTSPTNSGKSLPPVLLPGVCVELSKMGYSFPQTPRVLFVTALNSIQHSLVASTNMIGIRCEATKNDNVQKALEAGVSVLFIGPEVLKMKTVVQNLLMYRTDFMCKVIDEAHLGIPFYMLSNL